MSGSAPPVSDDDAQLDRASQLLDLSGALQKSGKPQEALDAAREGTDILRRMMQKDPAAYRPWFGWALMTLTLSLIDVEQGGEAPLSPEDLGDITKETPRDSRRLTRRQIITRRFWRNKGAVVGAIGFLLMVLFALLGDAATHWTFTDVDSSAFLQAPSADHWFGTTQGGRDVYAMVVEGTRKSMMIGVFVALLQTGIAAVIGSSAAYFGGWWEKIALWATDLLLVVPSFLIIAILSQRAGAAKGSIALFIILLAGFGWMLTARVVRSLTLSVKNLEYVNAARFMNVPSPVIIARHILPNIASLLIVDATINVAYAVISETTLSYFGFGVQSPNTSLGTLIAEGQRSATTYPWIFLAPAAVLVLMLLCVNVMGDGLRDAIDPSSKSGGKA